MWYKEASQLDSFACTYPLSKHHLLNYLDILFENHLAINVSSSSTYIPLIYMPTHFCLYQFVFNILSLGLFLKPGSLVLQLCSFISRLLDFFFSVFWIAPHLLHDIYQKICFSFQYSSVYDVLPSPPQFPTAFKIILFFA